MKAKFHGQKCPKTASFHAISGWFGRISHLWRHAHFERFVQYLAPFSGSGLDTQLSRPPQGLPLLHLGQALDDGSTKSRWFAVWPSSMIIIVIDHHHWSWLMISIDHHWWSLMSGIDHHWSALIIIHQHHHHQSSSIINHWSPSAATATATPFLL